MSVIKPIAAAVLAVLAVGAAWASGGENSSPPKAQAAPASPAPGPTVMTQELVRLPDGSFTVRFVMKPVVLPGDPATETPDGAVIVPENALGGEGVAASGRGGGRAGRSGGGTGGGGGGGGGGRSFAHGGGGGGGGGGGKGGGGGGGSAGGQSATARGAGSPVTARSEPRFDEATPVKLAANPPRTGITNPTAALGGDGDSGGVLDETGWVAENGQPAAAPTGLVAIDRGNHLHVDLTWDGPAEPGVTYKIEKRTYDTSAGWSSPMVVTAVQGRTDAAVLTGPGTFQFRVLADSGNGNAAAGEWVQITIAPQGPAGPGVPGNVTATDIGNRTARVSWTAQQAAAASYQIERMPAFSTGQKTVSGTVTNYIDPCGAGTFAYRVRAVAGDGAQTGFSAWTAVTIADTAPSAPTGLAAADMNNERDVELSWSPPSTGNATSIQIEHQFKDIDGVWMDTPTMQVAGDAQGATMHAWGGDHKYRVKAVNSSGSSAVTGWTSLFVASGWTQFTPSADTRIVYVSSSEGNDANDGLSRGTPKRTIAAGFSLLRDTYPDWLLLKTGDTWNEQLGYNMSNPAEKDWRKRGRSLSEPMVVATYGDPTRDRPLLLPGSIAGLSIKYSTLGSPNPLRFVVFSGFEIRGNGDVPTATGIDILGGTQYIRIEDVKISWCSAGINVVGYTAPVDELIFHRCIIADCFSTTGHGQGIFLGTYDAVANQSQPPTNRFRVGDVTISECVLDRNGWADGLKPANIFNRNMYLLAWNITVRGCIDARGASGGIQQRLGGTCEDNLVLQDPIGISFGHAAAIRYFPGISVTGVIRRNLIIDARDIDSDPRAMGIGLGPSTNGVIVSDNIVAHQRTGTGNVSAIWFEADQTNGETWSENNVVENNTVYDWGNGANLGASCIEVRSDHVRNNVVRNNILCQLASGAQVFSYYATMPANLSSVVTFQNNRYFAARTTPFRFVGDDLGIDAWRAQTSDNSQMLNAPTAPVPGMEEYMQSIGRSGGIAEFLTETRLQRRGLWRSEFTSAAVNAHVRQ